MIEAGCFNVWKKDDERRVVYSRGKGVASAEDVQKLMDAIMETSKDWHDEEGFAYMAFIEDLQQVDPTASEKYVLLHQTISQAHCKCIAYIEGNSYEVSIQSHRHKKMSDSSETKHEYFTIEDEGLAWFKKFNL